MMTEAISANLVRHHWGPTTNLSGLKDEELVLLAQSGSITASERLMFVYGPVVRRTAARYYFLGSEKEDVIQEGFVGLCNAIRSFRPSNLSGRFQSFAFVCVTRQIQTAARAASRGKHSVLNRSTSSSGQESETECIAAAKTEAISLEDLRELMSEYCSGLTEFESAVLQGIASGRSYSDISKLLCCPLKSVDNGIQRAKRKILSNRSG